MLAVFQFMRAKPRMSVATLLYVGLTLGSPEPFAYLVAHGLKILGGVGGGAFAGSRRAATTATDVAAH